MGLAEGRRLRPGAGAGQSRPRESGAVLSDGTGNTGTVEEGQLCWASPLPL